jgi:hypothetical protein
MAKFSAKGCFHFSCGLVALTPSSISLFWNFWFIQAKIYFETFVQLTDYSNGTFDFVNWLFEVSLSGLFYCYFPLITTFRISKRVRAIVKSVFSTFPTLPSLDDY